MARNELIALLDDPHEVQEVEYKSWLDLSDPKHKADLARHIAAISNYGGGHIVFGFEPLHLAPCAPDETLSAKINHDIVAGIVGAYLTPAFHCEVLRIESRAGNIHPIIRVPPHGAVPICAKKNGPDNSGQPQGISAGTHYLRKPGPKSEAIRTPEEWAPVIRRCALHEKASILSALSSAMRGTTEQRASGLLEIWHTAARAEFVRRAKEAGLEVLARSHVQFSYRIISAESEVLPLKLLERTLSEVNSEVHDLVSSGWSMFYPFPDDIRRSADPRTGDEDFLQLSFVGKEVIGEARDFWRASPLGLVTLVRDYWEDNSFFLKKYDKPPETIIDPFLVVRSVSELVRHARGLAERFPTAQEVEFRCEWYGLAGRRPFIGQNFGRSMGHPTDRNDRLVQGTYALADLATQWPDVVASLVAPLSRTFGFEDYASSKSINGLAASFLRL